MAFMGYISTPKVYKLLNLETKIFFVSGDVRFREDIFPFKRVVRIDSPLFNDSSVVVLDDDPLRVLYNENRAPFENEVEAQSIVYVPYNDFNKVC